MLKQIEVKIDLTPEDLADIWCDLDSEQQAKFFNQVANISSQWDRDFPWQMQHITDESCLTAAGRDIMKTIGEYSE